MNLLFEIVGLVTLSVIGVKCVFCLANLLYVTCFGRLFGFGIDVRQCGPWAVVTGATDGIGKSFAKSLAAAGLNLVLVSRTSSKLKTVAEEMRALCSSIEVKTISVDFTDSTSIYPVLKKELNKLEVGILINNVGMSGDGGKRFTDVENEQVLNDCINCNVTSMVRMCHLILPQMIKRRKGVVINVGSVTSALPTPLLALYGATKAFIDKFSQDLAVEVKSLGVTVQTVHPGVFVVTNMAPHVKRSLMNPDADTYVESTLKTLGLESRTGGYWAHRIQLALCDFATCFLPRSYLELILYSFIEKEANKYQMIKSD